MDGTSSHNGRAYGFPDSLSAGKQYLAQPSNVPPTPRSGLPQQQSTAQAPVQMQHQHQFNNGDTGAITREAIERKRRTEKEKEDIVKSLFSKEGADGKPLEQYLAHIRVIEDGRYPTRPPPLDSNRADKKDRVIILALKTSGRILLHKARQNPSESYSSGKTWHFEDLSAIESFSNRSPRNSEEAQYFQLAGDTGFIVTILKPYFWQANTPQEKRDFITCLAKIYKRYTAGKLPQLIGFTPEELDSIHTYTEQINTPPSQNPSAQYPNNTITFNNDPNNNTTQKSVQRPLDSPTMPTSMTTSMTNTRTPYTSTLDPKYQLGNNSSPSPHPNLSYPPSMRPSQSRNPYSSETASAKLSPQSSNSDRPPTLDPYESLRPGSKRGTSPLSSAASKDANNSATNGLGIASPTVYTSRQPLSSNNSYSNDLYEESMSRDPPVPVPERRRPPLNSPKDSRYSPDQDRSAIPKPLVPRNFSPAISDDINNSARTTSIEPPLKSPQRSALGLQPSSPMSIESPISPEIEGGIKIGNKSSISKEVKAARMFGAGKKSAPDLLKKAAAIYGTFKPRVGGAGSRPLGSEPKSNEPDGINGVFSAGKLQRTITTESTEGSISSPQATLVRGLSNSSPNPLDFASSSSAAPPKRASTSRKFSVAEATQKSSDLQQRAAELQQKAKEDAANKISRRTPDQMKFLENVVSDPVAFEGLGLEYEVFFQEFWPKKVWHQKRVDSVLAEIRREKANVQTGGWREHLAEKEKERNEALDTFAPAEEECDQLLTLTTLYSAEMGSLKDDIAFIEAQGQGLQVQTSNQKRLKVELGSLLETLNIPSQQLDPIFTANIVTIDGLESLERCLPALYKAILLVNPSIKRPSTSDTFIDISSMQVVREKGPMYIEASNAFLKRFKNCMEIVFGQASMDIQAASSAKTSKAPESSLEVEDVNAGREALWKYSPLMLLTMSLDRKVWLDVIEAYQNHMRNLYSNSITAAVMASQKLARGSPGDEQDLCFTSDAQPESLGLSSRKLTVRRSQTLARTLRNSSGDKALRQGVSQLLIKGGSYLPFEVVELALNQVAPLIVSEQAFVVDFFHATTTETADFAELVQAALPESRHAPPTSPQRKFEPDLEMAKIVANIMAETFSFFPAQIQSVIDWALSIGPLQGVGILQALHTRMASTEDGFFLNILHSVSNRLANKWNEFLATQIRAIEETQVKINKRKGILSFMRVFPSFTVYVESMLPAPKIDEGEVRKLIDQGYSQLNKAMFSSLRAIAKTSPTVRAQSNDPEDKDSLNYHILIIENMNHYVENVESRGDTVLEEGKRKAGEEYDEHLSLYIDSVIRRPLGKIMDLTDSLTSISAVGNAIATNPAITPNVYRKLISSHDSREIRRGIESLRKRIEKHFADVVVSSSVSAAAAAEEGEGHGGNGDRSLLNKVLSAAEQRYLKEVEKLRELPPKVYGEDAIQGIVWAVTDAEVSRWFKGGR